MSVTYKLILYYYYNYVSMLHYVFLVKWFVVDGNFTLSCVSGMKNLQIPIFQ